jgi:hypothetical protein
MGVLSFGPFGFCCNSGAAQVPHRLARGFEQSLTIAVDDDLVASYRKIDPNVSSIGIGKSGVTIRQGERSVRLLDPGFTSFLVRPYELGVAYQVLRNIAALDFADLVPDLTVRRGFRLEFVYFAQ